MDNDVLISEIREKLENEFVKGKKAVIKEERFITYDVIRFLSDEGFQVVVLGTPNADVQMIVF